MKRQKYLYHWTPTENIENILKKGLLRNGSGQQHIAIYLAENPMTWKQPGQTCLKVQIEGLTEEMTTFLPEQDEILYWGDIEPERISWAGCLDCRRKADCGTTIVFDLFRSLGPDSKIPICRSYE